MIRMRALAAAMIGAVVLAGCAAFSRQAAGPSAEMPYPPKGEVKAGDIYHLPTGLRMSFEQAMDVVSGARLVCIGETHDNIHAHEVELAVIRELARRFPGKVAIGMEMFREPQQEALDRWTKGELTELEFLKASKWHENWGSDFGYYRAILDFARDNRIDVVALDPSKELEREVSRTGLDNVPADVAARLPVAAAPDPYQRAVLKAVYGAHLPSEGMFEAFFRVQMLWEESMASRIVEYLSSPRGEGKKIVTLTGGWHVRYGFGVPKKTLRRMPMPYVILLPEEIEVPEGKEGRLMNVDLPDVPLLAGDFEWMVAYDDLEKEKVRLGVTIAEHEGEVIVEGVEDGSPAAKAGILAGSVIVSIDGNRVTDLEDVFYVIGAKREGDKAEVVVRREGTERTVEATFFRMPKPKAH